jgi:hypothetical protein
MFCITALQWKTTIQIAAILLSFKLNFVGILNILSTFKSLKLSVSMILKHTYSTLITVPFTTSSIRESESLLPTPVLGWTGKNIKITFTTSPWFPSHFPQISYPLKWVFLDSEHMSPFWDFNINVTIEFFHSESGSVLLLSVRKFWTLVQ